MVLDKEDQLLIKRVKDIATKAYYSEILTHTDFFNLHQVSIFHFIKKGEGDRKSVV